MIQRLSAPGFYPPLALGLSSSPDDRLPSIFGPSEPPTIDLWDPRWEATMNHNSLTLVARISQLLVARRNEASPSHGASQTSLLFDAGRMRGCRLLVVCFLTIPTPKRVLILSVEVTLCEAKHSKQTSTAMLQAVPKLSLSSAAAITTHHGRMPGLERALQMLAESALSPARFKHKSGKVFYSINMPASGAESSLQRAGGRACRAVRGHGMGTLTSSDLVPCGAPRQTAAAATCPQVVAGGMLAKRTEIEGKDMDEMGESK